MGCRIQAENKRKKETKTKGISARVCWCQRGQVLAGRTARVCFRATVTALRSNIKLRTLVSVHGGALGVAAQLAICRGTDGPTATGVPTGSAALL
jgi:hypothetical protein